MAEQVRCLNCGGYRVNEEGAFTVDSRSDSPIMRGMSRTGCLISFGMAVVGAFIFWAVTGVMDRSWAFLGLTYNNTIGMIGLAGCAVSIIGIIAGIAIIWGADKPDFSRGVKVYNYYCILCGYRWTQRSDQPPPKVNVRPDLIAKGVQKLENEEADRIARMMAEQQWNRD